METTEKIVESYCRYVRGWFTIPNIKCNGQHEIDILAVEALSNKKIQRYHIECGVSISGSFSKLTGKAFSNELLKKRVEQASQRRTVGYFIQKKFNPPMVIETLQKYGFENQNYSKIIVTWGWKEEAKQQADEEGVILWDFRDILKDIDNHCRNKKTYFTDDTLRTIQLFRNMSG